jgi:hypothetical protein
MRDRNPVQHRRARRLAARALASSVACASRRAMNGTSWSLRTSLESNPSAFISPAARAMSKGCRRQPYSPLYLGNLLVGE